METGLIDLHTHILPGVDDGAGCFRDAREMAGLSVESGVGVVVATPHANQPGRFENYDTPALRERFLRLEEELAGAGSPLKLLMGMEIMASLDVAEKIGDGRLLSLNGSDYYLLEFPFDAPGRWIQDRLEEVLALGKTPIIAHPERYACVQESPRWMSRWSGEGCLAQLNKGSISGQMGRRAARAARALLDGGLAACVASDAHSATGRTTYLEDLRYFLADAYGVAAARRLLAENPRRILENKPTLPMNDRAGPGL